MRDRIVSVNPQAKESKVDMAFESGPKEKDLRLQERREDAVGGLGITLQLASTQKTKQLHHAAVKSIL
jgi:hypothetical protein